jgi:beta-N-acetylhexosaminidase
MKQFEEMTLREKIGQMIMVGFDGYEINDHIITAVKKGKIGNVIIFARNFKSVEQLYKLNKDLYKLVKETAGLIPLVSVDQEGGMVTRITDGATFLPGNMTIGATKNLKYAHEVGKIAGSELSALGINMNLGPVLDINNNPRNPVIGVRSYSDDPVLVYNLGIEYIKGLQSSGIIATAKHFPGHGDATADSHYSKTIIDHSVDRLNSMELVPFKAAIHNGIKAIMSAHVLFPAYEPSDLPATLSKNVLTSLLKDKLKFSGLVVTDCMEMKAIDTYYGIEKASVLAVLAGADLICISHTLEKQLSAVDAIEKAVLDGTIPLELIDASVQKIIEAKVDVYQKSYKRFIYGNFENAKNVVLNEESKQFAQRVVDESFTLSRGKRFEASDKVLVIAPEPFATTIADESVKTRSLLQEIKNKIPQFDTLKMNTTPTSSEIDDLVKKAKKYDKVVICTYNANIYQKQIGLVYKLIKSESEIHVISMRNPYDTLFCPEIKNYACVYEYTPASVATVIKYLKEELDPVGQIPVNLSKGITTGVSVYVGLKEYSIEDNLKYLELAKNSGADIVFTSAHIPEMSKEYYLELEEIIKKTEELGLKLIIDVSKPTFHLFQMPKNIYALRLDYGFTEQDIVDMTRTYDCFIELNASTLSPEKFERMIRRGLNVNKIRLGHNFYPKKYTGLSRQDIKDKNDYFASYGISVLAFVPSRNQKRPPIYEGCPTVESHRDIALESAIQELHDFGVSEICFADAYASQEEILTVKNFDYTIIQLPTKLYNNLSDREMEIILKRHRNRTDESPYMKRSTLTRVTSNYDNIEPNNVFTRHVGSITIDNKLYNRYQGELSIIKQELPSDERVNVVGYVYDCEYLLEKINPGKPFKFIIKE